MDEHIHIDNILYNMFRQPFQYLYTFRDSTDQYHVTSLCNYAQGKFFVNAIPKCDIIGGSSSILFSYKHDFREYIRLKEQDNKVKQVLKDTNEDSLFELKQNYNRYKNFCDKLFTALQNNDADEIIKLKDNYQQPE